MSEKLSTIILKVDLQCGKCNKKIRDTLSRLQDKWNIRSIVYDEKNNLVTISGLFDPKKLIKKICSKACKAIQDIQIVEDKPKPTEPPPPPPSENNKPEPPPPEPEPAPAPPAAPEPPPPAEPEPEPSPPAPEPEPPAAPEPPPPAPMPEPEPPKPEPVPPQKVEPEPPKPEPVAKQPEPAYPYPNPAWTAPGPGSCCCCRPWFEAYYGGCRCCNCGCVMSGPVNSYPPPQVVYTYGGPCYDGPKTCEFIFEEQPSTCGIM